MREISNLTARSSAEETVNYTLICQLEI